MNSKYLSVTAINKYLKVKFDNDDNLRVVFLKGEVSNIKYHTTGHIYFSIKDENSKINAIMFAGNAKKLLFNLLMVLRYLLLEELVFMKRLVDIKYM